MLVILELFDSSNKFFGPLNITHLFREKSSRYLESQYLEYLGRSNKIVEPLDDFLSFSQTFVVTFRPKFESSKVRTFYSIFWLKKYITKVFSFLSNVFLRKMAPIKGKLTNKSLAEKCKALKDLENGLLNKDVATKYDVLRNTISTWVKNKHKLTASLEKKGMNSSQKNTRCGNYEKVDKAIYNWLVCRKKKPKIENRDLSE